MCLNSHSGLTRPSSPTVLGALLTTMNMHDHLVGRVLDGRYEIVRRLARGGMATVYLATDRRLSRTVALKVMHEGLGDDQEFARKFDREARAAAKLSHPNIVSVFDQGLDGGRPYIVMEYVEGRTLRNIISTEAPLDPIRALDLIEPVVAAVAAAHASGLIHRDIKPENVLISDRGRVKVVDFGLAKAVTAQTATATKGLLLGTVSYIAPELVTEGRPKPASDVYSIGVVLFEMLTGTKPHTGDNPIQVAYSHVHKSVPPPSSVLSSNWLTSRSAIPPYLDTLVTTATERELNDRPHDARVMLAQIRAARKALGAGVTNDPQLTDRMHARTFAEIDAMSATSAGPAATTRIASAVSPVSPGPTTAVMPARTPISVATPPRRTPTSPNGPPTARMQAVGASTAPGRKALYRRRRRAALLVLVCTLALVVSVGAWWMLAGRYTETPSLVNKTETDARAAVQAAGLEITFEQVYSETVPSGSVVSTDPGAGEQIVRGGTVTATVSKGPERYTVPTLAGLSRDAAAKALTNAHLALGTVTQAYSESVKSGTVIGASQKAGAQLKKGATVDLTVSKGPKPITITNYTGRPVAQAKAALEKAGFVVVMGKATNSKTIAKGKVASQSPASGTGKKGDTITLVESLGPVMVTVPNVRAMDADKAKVTLQNAGFTVKINKLIESPLGLVVSTNPAAGTKAAQGSTITINVA